MAIAVAVIVLVGAEFTKAIRLRVVAKTLASLGFVAFGVQRGLHAGDPAQLAVLIGLGLGAVGDVCLLSSRTRWFLAGIGAFLLNHVAYGVAFALLGLSLPVTALAGLGLAAFGLGVWRWIGPHTGSLAPAVAAYIAVIVGMVAFATGHAASGGSSGLLLAAVLFFTSDLAVARQRFIEQTPWNKAIGLPLYYAGQVAFAGLAS